MAEGRFFASKREAAPLLVLAIFTLLSTAGYGTFALRPGNLPDTPLALRLYGVSYQLFAQAHIVLAAAVLVYTLVTRIGWRWLAPLAAVYALSFTSEHVGTGYGIPFGGYEYTGLLGGRLGPRVPLLIPLSWFMMSLPAWRIARAAAPERRLARVALGAWGLVLWDLALDPAMSFLTPYWRWAEPGPYHGMPWSNLAGWYATGVVLVLALDGLAGWARLDQLPGRWIAAYYALVLSLPLGMLATAGVWPAVGVTLAGLALTTGVVLLSVASPKSPPSAATPDPATVS